jgi:hypothetical protein
MSYNYDSAGNIIRPNFLYPCPANCGNSGGCRECNVWLKVHTYPQDEAVEVIPKEVKDRFYAKTLSSKLL